MKVLYINYIPSPYRVDFFNTLAKECDLTVVYYHKTISERPNWIYKKSDHNYKHHILFKKEGACEPKAYLSLYRLLKKRDYDITVVGGYARKIEIFAILVLRLLNIPFVLNTDGGFVNTHPLKLKLKKILIKSASWFLASGSVAGKTLNFYGADKDKIFNYRFSSIFKNEILPNPLTSEEKTKIRKTLGLPTNGKIAITIGRYIPLKGYEQAIEAIHQLNDSNSFLYMIGEGPLRNNYEKLIQELNLENQVLLSGEQPKSKVLEYCKAADVMILPTLTSDVWGLVVNEAMSCGLPVIATKKVGAAHDMITNGESGYMIPVNSVESIKDALTKIFSSTTNFDEKVLSIARKYTIEEMVSDHIDCFNKIHKPKV